MLLGADQEGAWSVMYPDSSPGPGNMALGATGEPDHARAMYEVIGRELSAVGVDAVLAPCADCNSNPDNPGIGVRSFGERPGLVADMTEAAVDRGARRGRDPDAQALSRPRRHVRRQPPGVADRHAVTR